MRTNMRLVPDHFWAAITIRQEAEGEPFSSKVAVAEVILRRTRNKYMSDGTVVGTVLWPMQFSGWNAHDATPKHRERIVCAKSDTDEQVVQDCLRAWTEAENGSNTTCDAMIYWNPKISSPKWADKVRIVTRIDKHVFAVPL